MDMQIDIYQCGSKHIHVILRGMAEGAVAFFDFETFTKFVEQCQIFIDQHKRDGGSTQVPEKISENIAIPEAFLSAFDLDDRRKS